MTLSVYALNLVIGLSLGLAIDYSLLIVSRYREEMAATGPGPRRPPAHPAHRGQERAVQRGHRRRRARGPDALPAALPVLDGRRRRDRGRRRRRGRPAGAAGRAGAAGQAHQLARAEVLAPPQRARRRGDHLGLLVPPVPRGHAPPGPRGHRRPRSRCIIVALPALGINFTSVDARVLPTSEAARQVADTLAHDFPQDRSEPDLPRHRRPATRRRRRRSSTDVRRPPWRGLPSVNAVTPPQPVGPRHVAHRRLLRRTAPSRTRARRWSTTSAPPRRPTRSRSAAWRRASWTRRPAWRRTCPWAITADRAGHHHRPLPHDRLGGAADQGRDHEPAHPRRHPRASWCGSSRTAASRGCSTTTASAPWT